MNILGIETSCDETAASVVKNGKNVLSNIVVTSLQEHSRYGGIIPEIASRHHLESIHAIVEKALKKSRLKLKDIDAIAVTESPGLIGSLLVGISFAKALSFSMNKPLLKINHIHAHLYANFLDLQKKRAMTGPKLPVIGLVVSGGHTSLYLIKKFPKFQLLGQTLDDAAGEAFDKTARILKLGYPGGPIIDKLAAKKTAANGTLRFNPAKLSNTYNFSFSGIKTAVLYYTQKNTRIDKAKVAYAFQKTVVENLIDKSLYACKKNNIHTLLIGGGVGANSFLRKRLKEEGEKHKIKVYCPELSLCMDNAAMIAGLGYHHLKK